jgi:hypothetical protein
MTILYISMRYALTKNGKQPAYHEVMITPTALTLRDQIKAELSRKLSADSPRVFNVDQDGIICVTGVPIYLPPLLPSPCAAGSSNELLAVSPQRTENFAEVPVKEMANGSSVSGRTSWSGLISRCSVPLGVITWQVEE